MACDPLLLHLYSQAAWHDTAYVVGTRDALERLRDALTAALESPGGVAAPSFFTIDGEGFCAEIRCESEEGMLHYSSPYTADYARNETPEGNRDWPKKRGR